MIVRGVGVSGGSGMLAGIDVVSDQANGVPILCRMPLVPEIQLEVQQGA